MRRRRRRRTPMLTALLLCALCLPRTGAEPPQLDAARVKSALVELERAWKSDSPAERVRAIQANGDVPDPEVLKLVARGLRDKQLEVQRAAIEALRYAAHPDALKALHAAAREESPLRKDPELQAALLRAVGQHASASSVELLAGDLWSLPDPRVVQARVLGLGRIRTRESLERLLESMRSAGQQRLEPALPDFRLALVALSGVDQGLAPSAWQAWWTENRAKFKLAEKQPELPKDLERKWKIYWGEIEGDYRPRKRSERGRDGPGSS